MVIALFVISTIVQLYKTGLQGECFVQAQSEFRFLETIGGFWLLNEA